MTRIAPLAVAVMLIACAEPVDDVAPDAGVDPLDAIYLVPREPSYSMRFSAASRAVAVGGTQWIDVAAYRTGDPLTVPWESTASGAIAVVERAASAVRVAGSSPGPGRLDVAVEADARMTGALPVAAEAIASLWLSAPDELQPYPTPLVWLAGAAITVQVELGDAAGNQLVDDSLAITGDGSVAITRGAHWDQVVIAATPEPVALTITAGGQRHTRVLTRVDGIDRITGGYAAIPFTSSFVACFYGFRDDVPVAALPWAFEVDGIATAGTSGNCLGVAATDRDQVVIARSVGHDRSLTLPASR